MQNIIVVIPVYNAEKYLQQAVDSVLNQPYKDISIILVDDGSKDSSPALCDAIAASHVNIEVIHQVNAGVSAARNAGIDYALAHGATGYIAFLDADDAWANNFADQNIEQLLNQRYDILGFLSCSCNETLAMRSPLIPNQTGSFIGGSQSVHLHKQHFGAILYACTLLKQYNIRFQIGLRWSEDKIFRIQCMYFAKHIYLENRLLYLYRIQNLSVMHLRPFGILYFTSVIEGYIECDKVANMHNIQSSNELTVGRNAANWYVCDMILEHYENFGSRIKLHKVLSAHPEWIPVLFKVNKQAISALKISCEVKPK